MIESEFDVSVALIIKTDNSNGVISKIMGILPTKALEKGEVAFGSTESLNA